MATDKVKRALVEFGYGVAIMAFIVSATLFTLFMFYKHYGIW